MARGANEPSQGELLVPAGRPAADNAPDIRRSPLAGAILGLVVGGTTVSVGVGAHARVAVIVVLDVVVVLAAGLAIKSRVWRQFAIGLLLPVMLAYGVFWLLVVQAIQVGGAGAAF